MRARLPVWMGVLALMGLIPSTFVLGRLSSSSSSRAIYSRIICGGGLNVNLVGTALDAHGFTTLDGQRIRLLGAPCLAIVDVPTPAPSTAAAPTATTTPAP